MPGSPKKRAKRLHREIIKNLPALIPEPPPEAEPTDRFGKPTSFRPEYIEQARALCEAGATDRELGGFFDVDRTTIWRWAQGHPEFAAALKFGKDIADDRMERTAYELACGYTMKVEDVVKLRDNQGNEIMQTITRTVNVPPNDNMLWRLMRNRRPDRWKEKTETQITGEIVHLSLDQARDRLAMHLSEIKTRQLGNG
jgi:hypothetical protein